MNKQTIGIIGALAALASAEVAQAHGRSLRQGAVYVMSNDDEHNEVAAYWRSHDGSLSAAGTFETSGVGVGDTTEPLDALGSQGSLVLSDDGRFLLAVNAGSDEISVFRVGRDALELSHVGPSGGLFPASIAMHGRDVYVLNAGGDGNITGFTLDRRGRLTPKPGSTRGLDAGGENPPFFLVSPAQIAFSPDGEQLVLTNKGDHSIRIYATDEDGLPSAEPVWTESSGLVPFGFSFTPWGALLVAEAFGAGEIGAGEAGAVSSYGVAEDGRLQPVSESVPNFQTATCWLEYSPWARLAFTTNNGQNTVSSYRVSDSGEVTLLAGAAASTGEAPVDLALSKHGKFLYTLNTGDGTVSAFAVGRGALELQPIGVLSAFDGGTGSVGLAAR